MLCTSTIFQHTSCRIGRMDDRETEAYIKYNINSYGRNWINLSTSKRRPTTTIRAQSSIYWFYSISLMSALLFDCSTVWRLMWSYRFSAFWRMNVGRSLECSEIIILHWNRSDAHIYTSSFSAHIQSLALKRAPKDRELVIHIRLAIENIFYGQNLRQ